jgi:hypothetical protein
MLLVKPGKNLISEKVYHVIPVEETPLSSFAYIRTLSNRINELLTSEMHSYIKNEYIENKWKVVSRSSFEWYKLDMTLISCTSLNLILYVYYFLKVLRNSVDQLIPFIFQLICVQTDLESVLASNNALVSLNLTGLNLDILYNPMVIELIKNSKQLVDSCIYRKTEFSIIVEYVTHSSIILFCFVQFSLFLLIVCTLVI